MTSQQQPSTTERSDADGSKCLSWRNRIHVVTGSGLRYRRLNKREYSNTVRDLLGLTQGDRSTRVNTSTMTRSTKGLTRRADSLVISNELLLEYMEGADKSLRHALFTS